MSAIRNCLINIFAATFHVKSRGSSVGIANGYGLDDRGSRVRFLAGAGNFSLRYRVHTGSGTLPASYPMGTGDLSPGLKWPEREAHRSPPSSAEAKNAWSYTSTLPNTPSWPGAQLKKRHRDSFTLTFTLLL
jgi:hypothetical protein